jgi:ABC-2 type transport system ATP-binding protein
VEDILTVDKLTKTYRRGFIPKPVLALKEASFAVKKGRITGFIGANGAGKTTTIRCLLNFTHLDSGRFFFFGTPGFGSEARKRVGYLPEHPHFYGFLSGFEFLKFYAQLSGKKKQASEIMDALEAVRLKEAADRPLSAYSKGMLQRVGLAQAMIHKPELLILDEPMSGLDPDGRRLVRNILLEVAQRGVTLFFSTHLLDDAENLCDDIVLMAQGKVVYAGSLEKVLLQSSGQHLLRFEDEAHALHQEEVAGLDKANHRIREILASGGRIVEVSRSRRRLEDVFSQWTGGPS